MKHGVEGWVAKSVARQLAMAVLWVRIQTSLKNHKWATYGKRRNGRHTVACQKNIQKKMKHGRMRIAIILMPVRIRIWIGINIEIRIHKDGDPHIGAMYDFWQDN
jgi:hypothetical protein